MRVPTCEKKCTPGCELVFCTPEVPCDDPCRMVTPAQSQEQTGKQQPRAHSAALRLTTDGCGEMVYRNARVTGKKLSGGHLSHGVRYPSLTRCGTAGWLMLLLNHYSTKIHLHQLVSPSGSASSLPTEITQSVGQLFGAGGNAAITCLDDGGVPKLTAFGGSNDAAGEGGIRRSFARSISDTCAAGKPCKIDGWHDSTLVNNGRNPNCTEARSMYKDMGCEFDGKLSVVHHHNSLLLYARANLQDYGSRFVQVARSRDQGLTWTPFQLLEIEGITPTWRDNNIYFFTAMASGGGLVGLMPAVLGHADRCEVDLPDDPACEEGGLYATFSHDGLRWSKPEKLLESSVVNSRTPDQPIGAIESEKGEVSVFVLRNVDVTEEPVTGKDEAVWGVVRKNLAPGQTVNNTIHFGMIRCPATCPPHPGHARRRDEGGGIEYVGGPPPVWPRPFVCRYDLGRRWKHGSHHNGEPHPS
jgi:hypothetical protein